MDEKNFKLTCQVCKSTFESIRRNQKYCGYNCSNVSRGFFHKHGNPQCQWCKKEINRPRPSRTHKFCSKLCADNFSRKDRIEVSCKNCQKRFFTQPSRDKKFCSRKCMGVEVRERNKHRTPQYRSYGECAIFLLLKKNFGDIHTFIPNDRIQLDGYEIDIWIPSLKIGIEYNGTHHFKPVYGEKVFEKTKVADENKRTIASAKGITIVDLNVNYSLSYTAKTKLKEMFSEICGKINLIPTSFDITYDEVMSERNSSI